MYRFRALRLQLPRLLLSFFALAVFFALATPLTTSAQQGQQCSPTPGSCDCWCNSAQGGYRKLCNASNLQACSQLCQQSGENALGCYQNTDTKECYCKNGDQNYLKDRVGDASVCKAICESTPSSTGGKQTIASFGEKPPQAPPSGQNKTTTPALPSGKKNIPQCTSRGGGGLLSGVCAECARNGSCQLSDFFVVGNNVVKLILGLSGSAMLLMFMYGGFYWLTSAGNSDRVEHGTKAMSGAVIGLIIVFTAYAAVQFILGALGVDNVAEIFKRPFTK